MAPPPHTKLSAKQASMIQLVKSLFERKKRLNALVETSASKKKKEIEMEELMEVINPIVIIRNSKDI